MLGLDHPFFRHRWRRIAVVLACLGWALFEFVAGAPVWGLVFGALGCTAAWQFRGIDWSKHDDG